MSTPKICIVIDVEATCWPNRPPNEIPSHQRQNEIIEFGVTIIDLKAREITESASIIVSPTTTEISEFCTELTTLTPEYVKKHGVSFHEALDEIEERWKPKRNMWASWGSYDRDIINRQCEREHTNSPFNNNHLNIKAMWCWKHGFNCGVGKALPYAKLEFDGTPHRGIDDSRMIAKLLLFLSD